jgi:hypothetical protein
VFTAAHGSEDVDGLSEALAASARHLTDVAST